MRILNKYWIGCLLVIIMSVLCFTLSAKAVEINDTNFPDTTFREYVSKEFDSDHNGILSAAEISRVKSIYLDRENITDLKGVEYFRNAIHVVENGIPSQRNVVAVPIAPILKRCQVTMILLLCFLIWLLNGLMI